jgi:hypothetical protein
MGVMKRHITDEADMRLAYYLPLEPDEVPPPGIEIPPRPKLPDGVVDTPLVRLFNFLRTYLPLQEQGFTLPQHRNHVSILPAGDSVVPSTSYLFSLISWRINTLSGPENTIARLV